ncbi:hypothetical protein ABG768_000945 [Culter alburnus]|uniref:ZP domain-containing protein n=1 Tax=Culter alburnus TaxID=194366 RepID=A0AAW2B8M8_CULAL
MWLNSLLIVFLSSNHLVFSLNFNGGDTDVDLEEDWNSMENFTLSANGGGDDGDEDFRDGFVPQFKTGLSGSEEATIKPLNLPGSVRIPASMLHKELFTPEIGGRPMPSLVKSILLAEKATGKPAQSVFAPASKMVDVMCYLDRIHVRVLKSLFTNPSAWKDLKLGTCAVNKATDTHYHFLYYLKGCEIIRGEDANRVTYTNTLYYRPMSVATELIVRELPFTVPIRCSYTKFHRSYAVGFLPRITGGTFYKPLHRQSGTRLAAMDASWNNLLVGQSFVIGKPMCFEAKGSSMETRKRMYLNSCFVTSHPSPLSTDKYPVVENYGCLVDSKNSALTKFYTSPNKLTVRFCMTAFMLKNMVSQPSSKKSMFMHCEFDFGPEIPTPSAKSCMYNAKYKGWTELYGDSSVCNCCASTCPAPLRATGRSMITSDSWDLKMGKESSLLSPKETMPDFSLTGHDDFALFWESDY